MNLVEKIREIILNRRIENKLQKRLETVKDIYHESETEKEAIQKATQRVIEEINGHPNMPVTEFLKMIQKEEKLSTDIIIEVIKQILEVKPEKTAVIVQELNLPSEGIQEIIRKTNDVAIAKEMVKEIPNVDLQKEERKRLERIERERKEAEKQKREIKIKEELKEKYKTCGELKASELIGELKTIQEKSKTPKIHDMIKQILARKAAIEWRQTGTTRIRSMAKVISVQEMLEGDFTKLVASEFEEVKKIKRYQSQKDYQFTEEDLQNLILAEMARRVAETYNRVGIIDIPQSDIMQGLSEEQCEIFIREIQSYAEGINEESVRKKMKGIKGDELEELKNLVEKIPEAEREEYIGNLTIQIEKGKQKPLESEVAQELEKMVEGLKDLDVEDAIRILEDAREKIEERKMEIMQENIRRIEGKKQEGETQTDSEGEYSH